MTLGNDYVRMGGVAGVRSIFAFNHDELMAINYLHASTHTHMFQSQHSFVGINRCCPWFAGAESGSLTAS